MLFFELHSRMHEAQLFKEQVLLVQQIFDIRRARLGEKRSRTLSRKVRQLAWAFRQFAIGEAAKTNLLREYLDTVYWGRSYYGLHAAAKGYFGLDPEQLTTAHSFFLAERLASPNCVFLARIPVLLNRPALCECLGRYGTTEQEIAHLYNYVYGEEGSVWSHLGK